MHRKLACEELRPLLFALLESEVTGPERSNLLAHLAVCTACRGELLAEQALNGLLAPLPKAAARKLRHPWLARIAALLVIGLGWAALAFLLSEPRAYGSIAPTSLLPSMTLADGNVVPLQSHNHLEVPLQELVGIEISDVAMLHVIGPAVLELDRGPDRWKLVLLKGQVRARIQQGQDLLVTSLFGAQTVGAGDHVLSAAALLFGAQEPPESGPDVGELLQQAIEKFFREEDMAAAEKLLRAALERKDISAEQQSQALFYLGGALGRQQKFAEAIEVQSEWLRQNPEDSTRHYVLLFQGIYHRSLGQTAEARECFQTILREAPESELAAHARSELDGPETPVTPGEPATIEEGPITRALLPDEQPAGGYAVVAVDLEQKDASDRQFLEVARAIALHHETTVLELPASDLPSLEQHWQEAPPQQVLFVLRPEILDVNLHRRILLLSARLDADIFPDFSFGYFTAHDGGALEELWARTRKTHADGLAKGPWLQAFVTGGGKSQVYESYIPELATAAGFEGRGYGFAVVEHDPECLDFVAESLPRLEGAAVLEFTGNGDPQGIWLFDDHRNIDASKHWKFAPEDVGRDEKGEMPRILAEQFAALDLGRPVVWSGTCHSAATHRVFVEGDIVSTFGITDRTTVYELAQDESLCLAMLEAGAVAYLAPIAANHGYSTLNEIEFALLHGASLGETIKSTYDDVFLAAGGALKLDFREPGKPHRDTEAVMQGGGANRILIGDPSLAPFTKTAHPGEKIVVKKEKDGSLEVQVTWEKGFHPRAWDIYGTQRDRDGRIYTRLPIEDLIPQDQAKLAASVKVTDESGSTLPYVITRAEPEIYHGRRYLHLQANGKREAGADRRMTAVFTLKLE